MARPRVHGIVESGATQIRPNGFVNRRSSVQSRAPAHDSQNPVVVEEWRPIPGVEDWYEASSLGRIRRAPAATASGEGRLLRTHVTNRGYLAVSLSLSGIHATRKVHTLVAEAFIGPRPIGLVVNHKDANKKHNAPSNLEYITEAANRAHAKAHGLYRAPIDPRCSKCGAADHRAPTCGTPDRRRRYTQALRKADLQAKLRRKAARAPETAALEWALRTFAGPMRAVRA